MRDEDEAVRLDASYALGAQEAVDALIDALRCEAAERWQGNLDRGDFTDPGQFDAPYGLAAAGAAAATALGYIAPAAASTALRAALADGEYVRAWAASGLQTA